MWSKAVPATAPATHPPSPHPPGPHNPQLPTLKPAPGPAQLHVIHARSVSRHQGSNKRSGTHRLSRPRQNALLHDVTDCCQTAHPGGHTAARQQEHVRDVTAHALHHLSPVQLDLEHQVRELA